MFAAGYGWSGRLFAAVVIASRYSLASPEGLLFCGHPAAAASAAPLRQHSSFHISCLFPVPPPSPHFHNLYSVRLSPPRSYRQSGLGLLQQLLRGTIRLSG